MSRAEGQAREGPGQYERQARAIRAALGARVLLLDRAGYRLVIRADRELYERTKRRLAAQDWTYMQQYADAKGEVVEAIMHRA